MKCTSVNVYDFFIGCRSSCIVYFIFYYYYLFIVGLYMTFIYGTAQEMTGNRMRERGNDTQQRAPGRDSNPGPLQR